MKTAEHHRLIDLDLRHVWHPFTQMQVWPDDRPLVIVAGEGNYLIDSRGERYLDGVSSLWLNVHGHRKKEIDEAIAHADRRRRKHKWFSTIIWLITSGSAAAIPILLGLRVSPEVGNHLANAAIDPLVEGKILPWLAYNWGWRSAFVAAGIATSEGKPATAAQIEAVLYNGARSVSRIVIDRFRKSVRGAERQAAREPLIGGEPEPIVIRITAALALSDIRQADIG